MKKLISVLLAVCMVFSMLTVAAVSVGAADVQAPSTGAGTVLTLKPNSDWLSANARFAAYFFGNGEKWENMTADSTGTVYTVTAPEGYSNVIFCRMNPATTANNWNNKWNQTSNLNVSDGVGNAYVITGWDNSGKWTTYTAPTEAATEAPVTYANHFTVDITQVMNQERGTWYIWTWDDTHEGTWRPIEKFGYVAAHDKALFACINGDVSWDNAVAQTVDFDVENDGSLMILNEKEEGKYKVQWKGDEPATEAPATEPATDAPATDAPAKLANGFYLIGDDWTIDAIDAADKFTANENAEGEYSLETTLAEKDEFKVVKVENDTITAWYPDGIDNNYVVDKAHAGDVTIYFQETYKADWADFGGYFYVAVPEAPTDAPATDAPATDAPATDAPADVDYYLFGYINGANYACEDDADNMGEYKFADGTLTAAFEKDSYVAVKTTGNANWYMTDGWQGTDVTSATLYNTTALGAGADKLFVPGGVEVTFTLTAGEGDTFTLSYTTKGEPATDAPATDAPATDTPVTDAPATDAPAKLADGFYLIGDNWTVDAIDAADKFTANENAEGEYFLETTLAEKDEFKVVKVENDTITAWYPDGTDNNYVVDKAHSGDVTIYFQETYKADWADFGGYFYVAVPEAPTDAPATDAPATDAPATDAPATDAPADVDYYLFGYINGANYACEDDADNMGEYKFADGTLTATFEKDSYVAVKTTGNANWYMTKGWQGTDVTSATLYNTTALGTDADKLFVPGGVEVTFTLTAGEGDTFTLSYTTKGEPATEAPATEPATDAPVTDAPVTDAPAKLANGFYLIGDNWTIDAIDAADKFTANENAEGEYSLETTLAEKDEFKVVKVENDTITAWYPDGIDNNYVVDKAHSGDVTIYFQETYKADWADFGGYFYVAVPEAPTDAPATDAPVTEPATDAPADVDYYLFGYINGANYACEDDADNMGEYKFADGTLTAAFEKDSYVAVKTTGNANWYMTDGWQGTDVTSATLYNTTALGTNADKLFVPGGVEVTFTLTAGEGDTFTLSYTTKGEPATEAPATEPATDAPVTEPATDAPADVDYYLFGYINGANYACEEDADNMGEYKFSDGTLTATFEEDSYVAVKTTGNANWYMTDGWQGTDVTSATLYNTTALGTDADKLFVPGGVEVTFTLTAGEDDTFILSYTTKDEPVEVKYDLNGDGRFSIDDATLLQRYLAEFETLTAKQLVIADVNEDGKVNVHDLTDMQRLLAGF